MYTCSAMGVPVSETVQDELICRVQDDFNESK